MKKNYLMIVLGLCCLLCRAQTTVTQAANEPSIGEVDKNYRLDTSAYTSGLPSAVTGSNVVWDFTKVFGAFPVIFDSIVAASAAKGGSAFPTATYAQKRSGINTFFQSGSNPAQTEWVGIYSPSLTITFTNSAIIATYPIAYGYSATDAVTGTFKYNNTNGVCNGSINVTADGYGTLNLPNNVSFQNVLRVRSVETLTLTTSFITAGTIKQSVFSYYVPGKKYPLITAQYQDYQLLVGTPTITAMAYGNFDYFTVAGINDMSVDKQQVVYPNPFHDQLTYQNDGLRATNEFIIYNLQGQLLLQSTDLATLPLSQLSAGVYVLEVRGNAGTSYQKIVKE